MKIDGSDENSIILLCSVRASLLSWMSTCSSPWRKVPSRSLTDLRRHSALEGSDEEEEDCRRNSPLQPRDGAIATQRPLPASLRHLKVLMHRRLSLKAIGKNMMTTTKFWLF